MSDEGPLPSWFAQLLWQADAFGAVLVDADPQDQDEAYDLLTALGFTVSDPGSGDWERALHLSQNAGVVVVGLNEAGEGLDLVQDLRSDPELAKLPLVVGLASEADRGAALAAGADACLVKPYSRPGLMQATTEAITSRYPG